MSVACAPEESKADDFNQAMSVAMSGVLRIYILQPEAAHQIDLHIELQSSRKV